MATANRIVCVESEYLTPQGHRHLTYVGIGDDPDSASSRMTVAQVRQDIANGVDYYTVGPVSSRRAYVERWTCACGIKTIRTVPDQVIDNNLDQLRTCQWRR